MPSSHYVELFFFSKMNKGRMDKRCVCRVGSERHVKKENIRHKKKKREQQKGRQYIQKNYTFRSGAAFTRIFDEYCKWSFSLLPFDGRGLNFMPSNLSKNKVRTFFYCSKIPWSRKSTLYRRSISYFGWSLFFSSRLLHVFGCCHSPKLGDNFL